MIGHRRGLPSRGAVSLVVISVAAALGLVACGDEKSPPPRLAVSRATDAFADQSRMAVTLSLVGTENDTAALFSDGEEVSPEDRRHIERILKSRLAIAYDDGADAKSSGDDVFAVDATVGDIANATQFRSRGSTVYVRAAVDDLVGLFGGSRGDLGYFLDSAEEAGFGFLAQGAAGKWLSTDTIPLRSFLKGMAQEKVTDEATAFANAASIGPDQIKEFRDAFATAWANDIGVERLGKDEVGDHFRLTSTPRKIYDRFLPAVRKLPGIPMDDLPPSFDVPDKQLHIDMWVKNERITRAEFDLTQFSESTPPPGPVVLRLDIDDAPRSIVIPTEDVVKVDLVEALGRYVRSMQQQEEEYGYPYDDSEYDSQSE